MEKEDEINFDTDLEDDEKDRTDECILPRLSFDKKLLAHRSNRFNQTFGQINVPFQAQSIKLTEADDNTLIPIRRKNPRTNGSVQIFEDSCQMLDQTVDWQLRGLLPYDNVTIVNRSLCFNDIRAFSTAIESNLESLTLSSVGLTSRSIEILCQGLRKCVHLHLLDLSFNKISKKTFEILVNTLDHLSSLLYLSLADCGIQDSYGRCIGDVCRHDRLTEINLSGNEFEEMACIFIGSALTENTSLIYLNLSWNMIRSYASIALFRGFEINKNLTEFDVSWSGLGYDGSVAIRRVLAVNKALQRLNISNCNIDWTCSKLISEGLEKNSTLNTLNLSFNPLTTHGVHRIVQALNNKKNAVSMLDISGLTVFSATVHLAEEIANRRQFIMKYDFEIPVHDVIGRQQVSKADSMRKIIENIDERNWRTLDYFRLLENKKKVQLEKQISSQNIIKSNAVGYEDDTLENLQRRITDRLVQPFTYKNLNDVIHQQRMRDRLQKVRQEKQENDLKKRNQKILQTVNQHFPDIDVMSKKEKHKQAIEQLSKPKPFSIIMGFTPYQFFLAGLMLITGTINTLSTKWADRQTAHFCHGAGEANVTFEHPFLQAVGMFLGEFLCLLAFKFIWYSTARYRINQMTYKGDASALAVRCWPININKDIHLVDGEQKFNPFIFWIAAIFDMLSTCLSYFALNLTSASSFQMLRGSVMVFTAFFSIIFLKKRLTLIHGLGIGTVVAGLVIVGVSDLVYDKAPEGNHTSAEKFVGILLILLAMIFTSLQVVYEERFIGKYNIPPLQAVGWEGIFGFCTLGFLLIPFYFIHMPHANTGPDHRLEDVPSAFCQMGNNYRIIIATVGNIFSIAFFNFAGISVTKELSSTTRMVLDSGRTLIIWAVSLALSWQKFFALQIVGFLLLVVGMGIYNGVWQHLYRRYISGEPATDKKALLPNYDEANTLPPGTGVGDIPSGAGGFVPLDKDSINGH